MLYVLVPDTGALPFLVFGSVGSVDDRVARFGQHFLLSPRVDQAFAAARGPDTLLPPTPSISRCTPVVIAAV